MKTELMPIPSKRQIILMISSACNLSCKYCYQQYKSGELMSIKTAKNIIETELSKIKKDKYIKQLSIEYMGGEPLLNFDLIMEVSEWLWSQDLSIPVELTIASNGTLLTNDIKEWLVVNKSKINFGLSMDGSSMMNNLNRTNKFIDWQFVNKNWPSSRTNITLFKDTVHLLAESVREMNLAQIPFAVSIGDGFEWTVDSAAILEDQLLELVPDYLNRNQEAKECGLFSFQIADYFPEYRMYDIAVCGKSNNIIAYDIDGSPCICHVFSSLTLGKEKAHLAWEKFKNIKTVPFDSECTDCPIHKNCRRCFGEDMRLYGTIYQSAAKNTICNAIKAKARACAFLFIKQIEQKIEANEKLTWEEECNSEKALCLLEVIPSFSKN